MILQTPRPSPFPQEKELIGAPYKNLDNNILSLKELLGEGSKKQYTN